MGIRRMSQFRRSTKRAQQLRNNATDAERFLWRHLRGRQLDGFKFSRQMPVGPFICDFMCRERHLVVELDGGQHAENATDMRRTAFLDRGLSRHSFLEQRCSRKCGGRAHRHCGGSQVAPTPRSPPVCGSGRFSRRMKKAPPHGATEPNEALLTIISSRRLAFLRFPLRQGR